MILEMYAIKLFPAHAGVIPLMYPDIQKFLTFPRTCGGDPVEGPELGAAIDFSPHMRG